MKVRRRLRTLTSGAVTERWECDLGLVNGKRVAYWFATKADAEERLRVERDRLRRHGAEALTFPEGERHRFMQARDRLARLGATIEQAVDFYEAQHLPLKKPMPLAALLSACVLDKDLAGKRPRYLAQFAVSCRSFIAGREDRLAHTVTREEVQAWVVGNGWAPKTQRVYLGDLRALFSWAVDERVCKDNPCAGKFRLSAMEEGEIASLTATEAKALLDAAALPPRNPQGRHARPLMLWPVALGLFAGIRPQELARMDRRQVCLEERHVIVEARNAKTRRRRVVDLAPAAVAWLALDPERTGPVWPRNGRLWWERLREGLGWRVWSDWRKPKPDGWERRPEWPHDAMRHTFASMHYALHQNEALLKAQMGHSQAEDTLMRHYRALKTRAEAERFWALLPRD